MDSANREPTMGSFLEPRDDLVAWILVPLSAIATGPALSRTGARRFVLLGVLAAIAAWALTRAQHRVQIIIVAGILAMPSIAWGYGLFDNPIPGPFETMGWFVAIVLAWGWIAVVWGLGWLEAHKRVAA